MADYKGLRRRFEMMFPFISIAGWKRWDNNSILIHTDGWGDLIFTCAKGHHPRDVWRLETRKMQQINKEG